MAPVLIRPRARGDLQSIYAYYIETAGLDVAERFTTATNATFKQLVRMPQMGAPRSFLKPTFSGIRMWRVEGFETYLIFYFARKDGIAIERVIHAARDYHRVLK